MTWCLGCCPCSDGSTAYLNVRGLVVKMRCIVFFAALQRDLGSNPSGRGGRTKTMSVSMFSVSGVTVRCLGYGCADMCDSYPNIQTLR